MLYLCGVYFFFHQKINPTGPDGPFQAQPKAVIFQNYVPGKTYDATVSLCNMDTVSQLIPKYHEYEKPLLITGEIKLSSNS